MASVTIMLIMMAAAVPSWRYVMKNDAEEELIFRGGEIADAIARYQQRNGNALPPSLEVLVKGKFLRREYKDPMTKHGKWRFIRQGERLGAVRPPAGPALPERRAPGPPAHPGRVEGQAARPPRPPRPARPGGPRPSRSPARTLGGIQGVASTSKEKGLRVFNGRTKYNEWVFLPGQPRDVGRPQRRPGGPGRRSRSARGPAWSARDPAGLAAPGSGAEVLRRGPGGLSLLLRPGCARNPGLREDRLRRER